MSRDDQPHLQLTDADGVGKYPLPHFPFSLRRSGESDLCMPHAQVSRQHACIEAEPDGLYLRDLGSRHGTLRNGQRVERVRLRSGDQIMLGESSVTLVFLDGPPLEDTAAIRHETGVGARDLLERAS